jgi:hypothetical protein
MSHEASRDGGAGCTRATVQAAVLIDTTYLAISIQLAAMWTASVRSVPATLCASLPTEAIESHMVSPRLASSARPRLSDAQEEI